MAEIHEQTDPLKEGHQKHPIVERISNGERGVVIAEDKERGIVQVRWITYGDSWVFPESIRYVR